MTDVVRIKLTHTPGQVPVWLSKLSLDFFSEWQLVSMMVTGEVGHHDGRMFWTVDSLRVVNWGYVELKGLNE